MRLVPYGGAGRVGMEGGRHDDLCVIFKLCLCFLYSTIKLNQQGCGEVSLRMDYKPKTEEQNCVSDENKNHTETEENEPMQLMDMHLF